MQVHVVRERQVRPLRPGRREAVGQVVVGDVAHVLDNRRVAEIPVQQVPRRERHRELIAAESSRVLLAGLPHLVLHEVADVVRAHRHRVPEPPHGADRVVVRDRRLRRVPRHDPAGVVHLDVVKHEPLGPTARGKHGKGRREDERAREQPARGGCQHRRLGWGWYHRRAAGGGRRWREDELAPRRGSRHRFAPVGRYHRPAADGT